LNSNIPEPKKKINLKKYFKSMTDDEQTYWLKPLGVTGDPITEDRLFNQNTLDLYFSKINPSGVKIGHINYLWSRSCEDSFLLHGNLGTKAFK
jgi:hypothetical protein